ncbi:histidine kinase [Marinilactibacillus sp. Marseille-P9653]|uniref:sensor histidine kinase n=1 Tax=Marinilactibacillus sp. Marseille-P9653 TaxID=2866583 RepID=UPI001CE43995|nr:histidine kinase [Marinilactibacillus sp. Marseille-P9653]
MEKPTKQGRYISIKQKLLGSYFIMLIIPILLVGIYLTASIRTNLINNKMAEIENNNERIQMDYVTLLSSVTNVSDWIYQDGDLADLVQTQYANPFDVYEAYQRYQMFEDYLRYYDEIEHIRFYVDNDTLTSTTGIYNANETIKNTDWYQSSVSGNGGIEWLVLEDGITKDQHLNLIRSVYRNYELVGVLTIAVNENMVKSLLADSASTVFITLNNQTPLYSYPEYDNIQDTYNQYRPVLDAVEDTEGNYEALDSQRYDREFTLNIRDVHIPKTLDSQMQVVGVVPTDSILQDVNRNLRLAYMIILAVLSMSILMLAIFIRTFNKRIIKLKNAMTMVAAGQFTIPPSIKGNDELSDVYKHLVMTTRSIEDLMKLNAEHIVNEKDWELQVKDAQFKMLASQINPHFLYNTLEMIRMKALRNQDREVAEIVMILSKLMRKSLERKQKETKLSEELEFTELYLQIQKLRFGEHIDYEIENTTQHDYTIVPLIIQPLVENSFIHGIEPKIDKGNIKIKVVEVDGYLEITVKDNGIGMKLDQLEQIRALLASNGDSSHLGVYNVHQRIRFTYGPSSGLSIDSVEGEGTVAKIRLPIQEHLNRQEE